MKQKILWLDTEDTGLDPIKNDIFQLSGIIEIDGVLEETFDIKMKPLNPDNIEQEALQVTGVTRDQILSYRPTEEGFSTFTKTLDRFVDKFVRTDKFILGGHNVGFDKRFLEATAKKLNFDYLFSYIAYDTLDTAQLSMFARYAGLMPPGSNKLGDLCKYFDIPLNAHNAFDDIKATRILAQKIIELFGVKNG